MEPEANLDTRTEMSAETHPAWRRVQLARHPKRPHSLDYIEKLFTDFQEFRRMWSQLRLLSGAPCCAAGSLLRPAVLPAYFSVPRRSDPPLHSSLPPARFQHRSHTCQNQQVARVRICLEQA